MKKPKNADKKRDKQAPVKKEIISPKNLGKVSGGSLRQIPIDEFGKN